MATSSAAAALPTPSALSSFIDVSSAKLPTNALPLEVLHNLRYQHGWSDLALHQSSSSFLDTSALESLELLSHTPTPETLHPPPVPLLSGLPPRPIYTHPDYQAHLLAHNLIDTDPPPQQEWVLPVSIGEKWTLRRFCAVFDSLPERTLLQGAASYRHKDPKRVLLAMVSHQGKGGDGTVVYYIMQEGDVKPRQN